MGTCYPYLGPFPLWRRNVRAVVFAVLVLVIIMILVERVSLWRSVGTFRRREERRRDVSSRWRGKPAFLR